MENILYEGIVYWAYDYEITSMNYAERYFIRHLSLSAPLSKHRGNFYLTSNSIIVEEDENELTIKLTDISQLYLGYDNVYSSSSAKNFGLFWKPLRIELEDETIVYLVVDYRNGFSQNATIFELLKELC